MTDSTTFAIGLGTGGVEAVRRLAARYEQLTQAERSPAVFLAVDSGPARGTTASRVTLFGFSRELLRDALRTRDSARLASVEDAIPRRSLEAIRTSEIRAQDVAGARWLGRAAFREVEEMIAREVDSRVSSSDRARFLLIAVLGGGAGSGMLGRVGGFLTRRHPRCELSTFLIVPEAIGVRDPGSPVFAGAYACLREIEWAKMTSSEPMDENSAGDEYGRVYVMDPLLAPGAHQVEPVWEQVVWNLAEALAQPVREAFAHHNRYGLASCSGRHFVATVATRPIDISSVIGLPDRAVQLVCDTLASTRALGEIGRSEGVLARVAHVLEDLGNPPSLDHGSRGLGRTRARPTLEFLLRGFLQQEVNAGASLVGAVVRERLEELRNELDTQVGRTRVDERLEPLRQLLEAGSERKKLESSDVLGGAIADFRHEFTASLERALAPLDQTASPLERLDAVAALEALGNVPLPAHSAMSDEEVSAIDRTREVLSKIKDLKNEDEAGRLELQIFRFVHDATDGTIFRPRLLEEAIEMFAAELEKRRAGLQLEVLDLARRWEGFRNRLHDAAPRRAARRAGARAPAPLVRALLTEFWHPPERQPGIFDAEELKASLLRVASSEQIDWEGEIASERTALEQAIDDAFEACRERAFEARAPDARPRSMAVILVPKDLHWLSAGEDFESWLHRRAARLGIPYAISSCEGTKLWIARESYGNPLENLRRLRRYRRAYEAAPAREVYHVDARFVEHLREEAARPRPAVHCGNPECDHDLADGPRTLRICPGCKLWIRSRCGNEGCSADSLHRHPNAAGEQCPVCRRSNEAACWRCPHHGVSVPIDETQCPTCVRQHLGWPESRPLGQICRRPGLDEGWLCLSCVAELRRDPSHPIYAISGRLVPEYRRGVRPADRDAFLARARVFGLDAGYRCPRCRACLIPVDLRPVPPAAPSSVRFLWRGNEQDVFELPGAPGGAPPLLCEECMFPVDRDDEECPRCRARLDPCELCTEALGRKGPREDGAPGGPCCRVCRVQIRRGFYPLFDLTAASFCTNLFGCRIGGMVLESGDYALLPAGVPRCPLCDDETRRPAHVDLFKRSIVCCPLCRELLPILSPETQLRGRIVDTPVEEDLCHICGGAYGETRAALGDASAELVVALGRLLARKPDDEIVLSRLRDPGSGLVGGNAADRLDAVISHLLQFTRSGSLGRRWEGISERLRRELSRQP